MTNKHYVAVGRFWCGAAELYVGPFRSRAAAQNAVEQSGAVRGTMPRNSSEQVWAAVLCEAAADYCGRTAENTVRGPRVPGNVNELAELSAAVGCRADQGPVERPRDSELPALQLSGNSHSECWGCPSFYTLGNESRPKGR